MKHKIALAVISALLIGASVYIGLTSFGTVYAEVSTNTFDCEGNSVTISATAPTTATPGSTISVTNISSTSTVPNGYTLTKSVSTSNVVDASPTTLSGTWTGTGVGKLTEQLPNVSLTATGIAGSQIKMTLSSVSLYLKGFTNPIVCSVANGGLTTSSPGQSLTILTIDISAPTSSTGSSSTGSSSNTKPSSNTTTTTSKAASTPPSSAPPKSTRSSATTTPIAPAPIASSQTQTTTDPTTSVTNKTTTNVTIVVKNNAGHAQINAKVTIDNLPTEYTNKIGEVTFKNIAVGIHKLTVLADKNTVTRTFQLNDQSPSDISVAVKLPQSELSTLTIVGIILGSIILIRLILVVAWCLYKHFSKSDDIQPQNYVSESPALIENIVVPHTDNTIDSGQFTSATQQTAPITDNSTSTQSEFPVVMPLTQTQPEESPIKEPGQASISTEQLQQEHPVAAPIQADNPLISAANAEEHSNYGEN